MYLFHFGPTLAVMYIEMKELMYSFERLDNHRDMITQNMFREIKNPKHPLHY